MRLSAQLGAELRHESIRDRGLAPAPVQSPLPDGFFQTLAPLIHQRDPVAQMIDVRRDRRARAECATRQPRRPWPATRRDQNCRGVHMERWIGRRTVDQFTEEDRRSVLAMLATCGCLMEI